MSESTWLALTITSAHQRLTCASTALALAALAPLSSVRALHEHMDDGLPPASIANQEAPKAGKESYVQMHMAHEHHIGAFDLSSFFALHDLDRNGVLDVSPFCVTEHVGLSIDCFPMAHIATGN